MSTQQYSLAPGWNNAAGYVVLEETTVSGKRFTHIQGLGTLDDGEERFYINGTRDDVGEAAFSWLFTRLTLAQYDYLLNTINQGRRSNLVTARTRFNTTTYYDVNAVMTLPKVSALSRSYGNYLDVRVDFGHRGTL